MNLEPETSMSIINEDGRSAYRLESVWTEDTLAKAAREIAGKIDENVLARLGYFKRGTCEVECFDDGMDEGLDGEWFTYATTTWHLSCGHEVYGSERPRYCSTCGKRVVEP